MPSLSVKIPLNTVQATLVRVESWSAAPARRVDTLERALRTRLHAAGPQTFNTSMDVGIPTAVRRAAVPRIAFAGADWGGLAGDVAGSVTLGLPQLALWAVRRVSMAGGAMLGAAVGGDRGRVWGEASVRALLLPVQVAYNLLNLPFLGARILGASFGAVLGAGMGLGVGAVEAWNVRGAPPDLVAHIRELTDARTADCITTDVHCALNRLDCTIHEVAAMYRQSPGRRVRLADKLDEVRGEYARLAPELEKAAQILDRRPMQEWLQLHADMGATLERLPVLQHYVEPLPRDYLEPAADAQRQLQVDLATQQQAADFFHAQVVHPAA